MSEIIGDNFEFPVCGSCAKPEACKLAIRMSGGFSVAIAAREAEWVLDSSREFDRSSSLMRSINSDEQRRMMADAREFLAERDCNFSLETVVELQQAAKNFYEDNDIPGIK